MQFKWWISLNTPYSYGRNPHFIRTVQTFGRDITMTIYLQFPLFLVWTKSMFYIRSWDEIIENGTTVLGDKNEDQI